MSVILQIRRDYAENWEIANPTLAQGEIALELDPDEPGNGRFKVGDGIHSWNELQYGGFGGVAGAAGDDAAMWHHGVALPSNLFGVDGDFYWLTGNGDVYQKVGPVWTLVGSIAGPQGIQGIQGETGSLWLYGSGAPSFSIGRLNDYYVNTANSQVWLKGSSCWSVIGAIHGNVDGGIPSSTYGGIDPIDGGTP